MLLSLQIKINLSIILINLNCDMKNTNEIETVAIML